MNPKTENPDTFCDNPVDALKNDALTMVDQCIECGSCYVDCAFRNYGDDPDECQKMIIESNDFLRGRIDEVSEKLADATLKCAECNRCHNSCPEGIYRRHGNMMMKHMIGNPLKHRINLHPYQNITVKQPAIEKLSISKWDKDQQDWYYGLNSLEESEVLLYHGCYVYLQAEQCMKLEKMLETAGITYTAVGKLEYCCGAFGFYRGRDDSGSIRPRFIEMMEKVKPKRVITNCGHCLNAMEDLVRYTGSDAQIRHAAEELLELSVERKLAFAHMGKNFTIHDSCNFRSLHDDHSPLRSLLRRIGSIHEMMSHGRDGKCCGDVSKYYAPEHFKADNRKNKRREFVSSGAEHMVTVCAGCFENFHTDPYLKVKDLIDIAYESFAVARAEDEALLVKEVPKEEWENMSPKSLED